MLPVVYDLKTVVLYILFRFMLVHHGRVVLIWLLCHSKSLLSVVFFFNLNQLKVIFNHSSILPFNVSLLLIILKWLSAASSC